MKIMTIIAIPIIIFLTSSCSLWSSIWSSEDEIEQTTNESIEQVVEPPKEWAVKPTEIDVVKEIGFVKTKWLEGFNDPLLIKLIEEGKANNNDLKAAAGNMEKAWLLAKQSGAALKPTADLSLGRTQSGSSDSSPSTTNVSVGLKASWELDVWGRVRASERQSVANAQSARADYIFSQHSLSANIAKAYFKVIEAEFQADIARKNLGILNRIQRITQVKYEDGSSTGQDIALAKANIAVAQEQLASIEGSKRDALRGLEVLLGRYPNASSEMPDHLPDLPPSPPAGIPSDILERRPDIVAAERQIASAFNAIDQAKAARLPQFSLTSTISNASDALSTILNPANIAWQMASNLMAPLIDGGKRRTDVQVATIEQEQALANYVQKALTAFSEVENNLDQGVVLKNRESALNEAYLQILKAYKIAEIRYKEGESELLDTLQIQQQLISSNSKLLAVKRSQLEQRINLYLSLGGSW